MQANNLFVDKSESIKHGAVLYAVHLSGFSQYPDTLLISLLNPNVTASTILAVIRPKKYITQVLVDAGLSVGLGERRFFICPVSGQTIITADRHYCYPATDVLAFFNAVLRAHPSSVTASVLTVPQIEQLGI